MASTPRKSGDTGKDAPALDTSKLDSNATKPSDQNLDTADAVERVDLTQSEEDARDARQSEQDARGEDGYRRDEDGNVVNDEENEFALVVDSEGNVTSDPNKD